MHRSETMQLKQLGWAAGLMLLSSSVQAAPQPEIQELFKASRTPGGRMVAYPQGTPEMRVVRVGLPVGATIPLHTHPSPVVVVVTKGAMTNVRLVDGNEVVSVVRPGDGFLEGHSDEPHYVTNKGPEPAEALVTFASVEGLPNMIPIQ
ncbi:cupin domain-containing protein [Synechococcus sp. AH-736-A19]|nr:cupin domain-containing protein [Synechococcus sp. AH-736-A19]